MRGTRTTEAALKAGAAMVVIGSAPGARDGWFSHGSTSPLFQLIMQVWLIHSISKFPLWTRVFGRKTVGASA